MLAVDRAKMLIASVFLLGSLELSSRSLWLLMLLIHRQILMDLTEAALLLSHIAHVLMHFSLFPSQNADMFEHQSWSKIGESKVQIWFFAWICWCDAARMINAFFSKSGCGSWSKIDDFRSRSAFTVVFLEDFCSEFTVSERSRSWYKEKATNKQEQHTTKKEWKIIYAFDFGATLCIHPWPRHNEQCYQRRR